MSVVFNPDRVALHNMDCRDFMSLFLADNSVDAIVTDPPYGLSFMGKRWDYDVPGVDVWVECLRVLKPGGYLLSFGGTRTYHRLVCNIEDAGFEVRDQIGWAFGSGFPKSHNGEWGGTALKPAWEPICMARKPLIGTVEANWKEHGTGALNIDGCRIKVQGEVIHAPQSDPHKRGSGAGEYCVSTRDTDAMHAAQRASIERTMTMGRWPANLIHDGSDEVVEVFPQAKGQQGALTGSEPSDKTSNTFGEFAARSPSEPRGDSGSAARFFYAAKASKKDRGLDNTHPTVKPTDLMVYLCRLVTPPGGVVLDPFMGSGSTGKAALREGMRFIGCELSPEYMAIAEARIAHEILRGTAA